MLERGKKLFCGSKSSFPTHPFQPPVPAVRALEDLQTCTETGQGKPAELSTGVQGRGSPFPAKLSSPGEMTRGREGVCSRSTKSRAPHLSQGAPEQLSPSQETSTPSGLQRG